MAGKFHINSNNESQPCRATTRACRFGEDNHFESASDAKVESERRLEQEFGESVTLKKAPVKRKSTSKPKSQEKQIKPKGILGEKVALIKPEKFKELPFDKQVSTIARAYGYKGKMPSTLTYIPKFPGSRNWGNDVYSGDLVQTEDGKLGIYYSGPSTDTDWIMDPITGKTIKRKPGYGIRVVENVSFTNSRHRKRSMSMPTDFDIDEQLEKNYPNRERLKTAKADLEVRIQKEQIRIQRTLDDNRARADAAQREADKEAKSLRSRLMRILRLSE